MSVGVKDVRRFAARYLFKNKASKTGHTENDAALAMQNTVPAKRFAKPEETANAIVFLCSECASYINGINLPVDGGRTKSLSLVMNHIFTLLFIRPTTASICS